MAARTLAAGATLGPEDIRVDEVELTREPVGIANDPQQIEGKVLGRAVLPGTPLRPEWFRAKTVIISGDTVKVLYIGTGFSVAAEGKALANAADGQSVRVQVESGKVLSGTARDGRRVEIR